MSTVPELLVMVTVAGPEFLMTLMRTSGMLPSGSVSFASTLFPLMKTLHPSE
jgi:hypothetical protein